MTTKCNSIQIKSLLFLSNSVPLNYHRSRQLAVWHGQAYIFCGLYYCKTSCVQKIFHNKLRNCLSIKILRNKHVEVGSNCKNIRHGWRRIQNRQLAGKKASSLLQDQCSEIMGHSYQRAILEFNSIAIHILHNPIFFSECSSETHLKVINYKVFQNHIFSVQ